ncbi:MAG: recombinase family protein [Chloroflexota bacterium]
MPQYLWQTEAAPLLSVVLGYARVSKAEQKQEGRSIPAQHAMIREYINKRDDWMIGNDGRLYEDVQRGTRVGREGYQALLTEARRLIGSGRRVVIVVMMMDRFGRDRVERLRAWDELRGLGVEIHAVRDGGLQTDDLLEGFKALIANFEVKQLGTRIRNVFDFLHVRGWYHVGKAPWGYAFRPPTAEERGAQSPKAVLDLDRPEVVEAITEAFRMRAQGQGYQPISAWASALPEEIRGPRALDVTTIRTTFHNPVYIGRRRPVREDLVSHPDLDRDDPLSWPRGNWPQIIPDELWLAVQAANLTNKRIKASVSQKYALTGLVRCPKCPERMSPRPNRQRYVSRKTGEVHEYNPYRFVCIGPQLGAGHDTACMYSVSGGILDAEVSKLMLDLLTSLKATSPRARRELLSRTKSEGQHDQAAKKIEALLKQRAGVERVLAKAAERVVLDQMDQAAYQVLQAAKLDEMRTIDEAVAQLRPKQQPVPVPLRLPAEGLMATVAGWADDFPTASPMVRRAMYGYLFEYITPIRVSKGKITVRVKWTAAGWALLNWAAELAVRAQQEQMAEAEAEGAAHPLPFPGGEVDSTSDLQVHNGKTAEAIFRSAKTGQAVDLPFDQLERDDR